MKPCVRFAPSPTGEPHLGFARTALYNFLFAKNKGGQFLLRVEDTDLERSKKEYIDQIIHSLEWLGLQWDKEIIFQSNKKKNYEKYIQILIATGSAYRCFASKIELQKIRQETGSYNYNGLWRDRSDEEIDQQLKEGKSYTIRLKTPDSGSIRFNDMIYGDIVVSNSEIDDFIIVRSDGSPVYNFTNVIDDQDMGITHVIRGEDHISNTPKQIQIYKALGLSLPNFAHLPMILGEDKKRLSKRHGATSVLSYRDEGYQPEALLNYLALLGWNPGTEEEIMNLDQLISKFDFSRVQKKSAIFDPKKLNWISSKYFAMQNINNILKTIRKINPDWGLEKDDIYCKKVINILRSRCKSLTDLILNSEYFFSDPKSFSDTDIKNILKDSDKEMIAEIIQLFNNLEFWDKDSLEKLFNNFLEKKSYSFGKLFKPMRIALCGCLNGPSLFELMEILGKDLSINRLETAIEEFRIEES
tara:strand:+ start:109 stop:1521 length:1413 start_codon:yes stop_codon:yes gene_type:complete